MSKKLTKKAVTARLDELELEYDAELSVEELAALLPEGDPLKPVEDLEESEEGTVMIDGIEVGNPQVLRPKELPLVIKEPKDGWKNPQQAEYAAILNGYAYKNEAKWPKKRAALVKNLVAIGENPGLLSVLKGEVDASASNLAFRNHITQGPGSQE